MALTDLNFFRFYNDRMDSALNVTTASGENLMQSIVHVITKCIVLSFD